MLQALCGSQNVQKILLFLFVNGKCYGTQLHRLLGTALTPIQKALLRLEKGGIIVSYYEGKTRLYQFNPAFALLDELEALLKKAYILLPQEEKRLYYVAAEEKGSALSHKSKTQALLSFWQRLLKTTKLQVNAQSKNEPSGFSGKGKGDVSVVAEGSGRLIFKEKGCWIGKKGEEVNFSNVFRWTLELPSSLISLEHLRLGNDRPVFLFHLTPATLNTLSSVDSHLCEADTYLGQIQFDPCSFRLNWRVIGPQKNEELIYYYS